MEFFFTFLQDELLVAFEESKLMLEQFAAGSSDDTQDIIQLLQGQVAEIQSVNLNLKAEKEAMNQAVKKMVRLSDSSDSYVKQVLRLQITNQTE